MLILSSSHLVIYVPPLFYLQATRQSVNLSAHAYWVPESTSSIYLNYGAAMSEVINLIYAAIIHIFYHSITPSCSSWMLLLPSLQRSLLMDLKYFAL